MRRSTILLLLAGLSFFTGIGRGAIADTDEAFYAESAREMVESEDWITPHFNYEPRFQKPALYYWLTASVFLLTGPTEFSARFWSGVSGLALVLITAAIGRRWFDETTGLLAGAITATNFGYFALARMALPDLPLAALITLSIWCALVATLERERHPARWLLISAAAAALGFLMKGPLGVVIPALVVLPILLIERRSLNLSIAAAIGAVLLFLAIAAPWYLAMWSVHGTDYLVGFFVGDNYERFATTRFNDPRPWWFYVPVIAGGLLPWTPLAIVWLGPIVQFVARHRGLGTIDRRLLLWSVLPLIFFTLSIGKQPRYVLPMLPPIAVLLACSILERTRPWENRNGVRMPPRPNLPVVIGCALSGLFLIALAILVYRARVLFLGVSPTATLIAAVVIGVTGSAILVVSLTKAWRAAPAVLAVGAALTFAVLPYAALPAARDSTVQKIARLVRQERHEGEAIGTYGVFVRNLVFYAGLKHTDIIHDEHLADWLRKNPRALMVLPSATADRLERERGLAMRRLAELPYFDDGSIRVRMLIWPDQAADVQQVAVVRIEVP